MKINYLEEYSRTRIEEDGVKLTIEPNLNGDRIFMTLTPGLAHPYKEISIPASMLSSIIEALIRLRDERDKTFTD